MWSDILCRAWRAEFCSIRPVEEHDGNMFIFIPLIPTGSNQREHIGYNSTKWPSYGRRWLIKCLQGVLWCSFYFASSLSTCTFFFLDIIFEGAAFFSPYMIWKGWLRCFVGRGLLLCSLCSQWWIQSLCTIFLCFLTASRCGEQCHDTKHHVCSPCFVQQRFFIFFVLSSSFMQKSFQGHLFCMTKCNVITVV